MRGVGGCSRRGGTASVCISPDTAVPHRPLTLLRRHDRGTSPEWGRLLMAASALKVFAVWQRLPGSLRMGIQRLLSVALLALWPSLTRAAEVPRLPDTAPLTWEGDLSEKMMDGLHRDVERRVAASV